MARLIAALAVVTLFAPGAASAQAQAQAQARHFDLGGRLGIGYAGGEYGFNAAMAGDLDQALVLGIDGNMELLPGVKVGAFVGLLKPRYETYGTAVSQPTVSLGGAAYRLEASVLGLQLGLRGELALGESKVLGATTRPWGAAFVGWERLAFSYDATATNPATSPQTRSPKRTFTGFLAGLEAGVDIAATPAFAVGPFISVAFGKYRSVETSGTGNVVTPSTSETNTWVDRTNDIDSKYRALHVWTALGVRGRFSL